jgi:hypothetical protein
VLFDDQYAYVSSSMGGLYRRLISEMVSTLDVRSATAAPAAGFQLLQNYPNPFNPTTTVRYFVGGVVAPSGALSSGVEGPDASHVRLAVYDLLGREVAVLVDEQMKPGNYEVKFDGTDLASGVYLCRMQSGDFSAARRLVLVK